MPFQYELKLVREDADEVVFEESPNYPDAFTFLALGVALFVGGAFASRFAYEHVSWRKPIGAALSGGMLTMLMSITYFITSRIVLDRRRQLLSVQRKLWGIPWTREYPIRDIERIFAGSSGRKDRKVALALELRNARTAKLTLWAKSNSLIVEEHQLNEALKRFEGSASPEHDRKRETMTDDEWWSHTKGNAFVDLKKSYRKTLITLFGVVVIALANWPFFAGHPLHQYWKSVGVPLLLVEMVLWLVLVLRAAFLFIQWNYVRSLNKIDKEENASDG